MSFKFTFLALFFANHTAGLPTHPTSQNTTVHLLNSTAPDISTHALAKRTTANPPFDPYEINHNGRRTDGDLEGDILYSASPNATASTRVPITCLLPTVKSAENKSYAYSWTCASGKLETLNGNDSYSDGELMAPKCLAWMEEERKQYWDTDDGNKFCAEVNERKHYYYRNGQKRRVHDHPAVVGTTNTSASQLNEECQRMCQTVPAHMGLVQDTILSDHNNKINLATAATCSPDSGLWMGPICAGPRRTIPKKWEFWNYIETYSDQADTCKGCA